MSASHKSGDGPVANRKGGNNLLHFNTWNFKFQLILGKKFPSLGERNFNVSQSVDS